jgi:hypothetical protein
MSTQGGFNVKTAPDLSKLEDEGIWVELIDPEGEEMVWWEDDGEEHPVRILMAGSYSRRYRRAYEAQTTRAVNSRRAMKVTGGLIASQRRELAAACTLKWEGIHDGTGVIECNRENALALYTEHLWVLEQVEQAMNDHAGFSKKDSSN